MRLLALCALSLAGLTAAYAAATTVTITGTGTDAFVSGTTYSFSATGTATLSGFPSSTFSSSGTVDTASFVGNIYNAPITASFTLNFGGGNTMTGTATIPAGMIVPDLVGQSATVNGTASITGGTGIYAGYTGSFPVVTGSGVAVTGDSSTFTITSNGTINPPGAVPLGSPAVLGLTGLALALAGCWSARARMLT